MSLQVPVAGVEQVESAQLEPGSSIIGGGGEVPAQQIDGHLPFPAPLQCGRFGRHIGVDRGLGPESSRGQRSW